MADCNRKKGIMDILKFLIIIAIIAIPIIKEARKNKAKQTGTPPPVPKKPAEVFLPGENNNASQRVSPKKKKEKIVHAETAHAQTATPKTPSALTNPMPEKESDIAIRSAEDARKAIIWSEILNRKY